MLVAGSPQAGNHNDLYEIRALLEEMRVFLRAAGVEVDGLFLNADAGFDSAALKELCAQSGIFLNVKPNPRNSGDKDKPYESGTFIFDEVLYKKRASIERANGWLDAFKALLVRFETKARNWLALHYIAFLVIFFRKINHKNKV